MSNATPAAPEVTPPSPRRWGLRLILIVLALIVLVWAAPIIVASSPLVGWACNRVSAMVGGKVSVGSVSLGWFSPIIATNVAVHDADDRQVLLIPRVEGDRTLATLLRDPSNLGSFLLKTPKIDVTFEGNQSNLEKMLAKSLTNTSGPNNDATPMALPPQLRLEVVDATIDVHDADTKRQWPLGTLSCTVIAFPEGSDSVQVNAQGKLSDGTEPGPLKAEIALHNVIGANPKASIKTRFSSVPLALVNLITRRYDPGTSISGSLQGNGNIFFALKDGKPQLDFDGECSAINVTLVNPALREPLIIRHIRIPAEMQLDDQLLLAKNAEIDCDFGKVTLKGSLDLASDWRLALDRPGFDLSLDVSLANVAERLPKTLHLHQDLRLTSGRLTAHCSSVRSEQNDVVWQGNVNAADLRGERGKNVVAWADPMTLVFQARHLGKGVPLIDQLRCNTRFLNVEASSGADQFTLVARADLRELIEPLGQFIKLDDVQLSGQAEASLNVRRVDAQSQQVHGETSVKKLNFTWLTGRPWQEDIVTAKLDARVRFGSDNKQAIDAAEAEVKFGADRGTVTLTEPMADVATNWHGAANLRAEGDLTRWQKRTAAWSTLLDDWRLGGNGVVQASVRSSPQAIEASSLKVDVTNLRCANASVSIIEPTAKLQTAARWDAKTGAIALTKASVSCPTAEFKSESLTLDVAALAARGKADFAVDLARLRKWMSQANTAEPVAGSVVGRIDLQTIQKTIQASLNMSVVNFVYGPPANPTWRESEIKCVGYGSYDRAADVLRVDKIDLSGAEFNANAKGSVAQVTSRMVVDVDGMLAYDLAKLEPQLRPLLGKDVKIVGNETRPFRLSGPLDANGKAEVHFTDLAGDASIAWKSLHALGCDVGPAQAKAVLQKGWLQVYPIDTSLNAGKVHLQPNLRLEPEPREMILLAGPVIEKAKITPQMCASGLGYAMPLLANVAEAQGSLSLSLDSGRIPLAAPSTGEVKGTILLHSATVGVNPTLRELASAFKMSASTGLVKECKVPFQMSQGKVYHKDLELVFPEMTLKSSGAVGLDGSLAIAVEMPIPKRVADAARLTAAQAKQPLRIPIGGTLDHPRVDPQAINSITSVLGRSLLENELNKLLPRR